MDHFSHNKQTTYYYEDQRLEFIPYEVILVDLMLRLRSERYEGEKNITSVRNKVTAEDGTEHLLIDLMVDGRDLCGGIYAEQAPEGKILIGARSYFRQSEELLVNKVVADGIRKALYEHRVKQLYIEAEKIMGSK